MVVNGVFIGRCCLALTRRKIISAFLVFIMLGTAGYASDNQKREPAKLAVNKTMLVNFMKSLIIPGWGQWSNGHKGRAVAYLTAELAGIYGYQINHTRASDKESEFKIFADEHWDYWTWSLTDDGTNTCGYVSTHQMPTYLDENNTVQPVRDHHFYENISKYREFVCGWDDISLKWEEIEGKAVRVYTPNKYEYIEMRTLSNDLYKNAQVATTLIMLNHLISAFDAAFGTDITKYESTNYTGKLYINPLNAVSRIGLEVKF